MKKYIILIVMLVIVLSQGCDNYLDVNTDPNNPEDVDPNLALAPGISSAAYVFGGWWQIVGGYWSQHWTQSTGAGQYRNVDDYQLTPTFFDRQWDEIYAGSLFDLEKVRAKTYASKDWNYYLISTVVQCWVFQMMVDCFDQIPFSDALEGDIFNFTPVFDQGQQVYDSLIVRIDEALSKDLNAITCTTPGEDDLLFRGNMSNWIAFANTLKLNIYLRQVYARPAIAEAGIRSLIESSATFLTDVDAAMNQFVDEQNRRNPVYETGVDRLGGNLSASATTVNMLLDNNDPRLDTLFDKPAGSAVHIALTQGNYLASSPTNIFGLSTPDLTFSDPVYFFSAAEVNFLLAEAYLRWPTLTGGTAQGFYEAGITESCAKFGMADTVSYLIGSGDVYEFTTTGNVEADLEQIIIQKWISMINSQGVEAWLETNRTHYPVLQPSVNNVTGGKLPKRFLWAATERVSNPNIPDLKDIYDKVWWDTK